MFSSVLSVKYALENLSRASSTARFTSARPAKRQSRTCRPDCSLLSTNVPDARTRNDLLVLFIDRGPTRELPKDVLARLMAFLSSRPK